MWISRDEYEKLKINADFWKAEYDNATKNNRILSARFSECLSDSQRTIDDLQDQIKQLEVYKFEAEEYKQKYADEVQKRLELVKLLENNA